MRARDKFRTGTKIRLVHDQIRELAFARGPNSKLPTARELCAQFQINSDSLNETLRELESQNVIYRKQGSGIFVSPSLNTKKIVVVANSNIVTGIGVSPFWGMLLGYLMEEAQRRSDLKIQDSQLRLNAPCDGEIPPLCDNIVQQVREGKVDGVITVGLTHDRHIEYPPEFPLVSYGGHAYWHVGVEWLTLLRLGITALMDRGCRKIEFWRRVQKYRINEPLDHEKIQFEQEVLQRGFGPDEALLLDASHVSQLGADSSTQDQGYVLARKRLAGSPSCRPDAVYIMDDMLASGALYAMQEMGILPGRDLIVASQANKGSTVLFGYQKHLILVEVDPAEIARKLFIMLDRVVSDEQPDQPILYIEPILTMSEHE